MTEARVVETHKLTKAYSKKIVAVHDLDLSVYAGEIYGFLGPNGAGKTTTLRMLLGLVRPSKGTAKVMGVEPGSPSGLAKIGALVESPAFYPHLSGYDNLRAMAGYSGGVPATRIRDILDQVGLTERAGDTFKKYSLGMKQRLGVAGALLKDPELLILDEPTNGLDPSGVAEMRKFILSLAQKNKTVLLSSHMLREVEEVCDRVGIVQKGKLVAEGTPTELRGQSALIVRAEPIDKARNVVSSLDYVQRVENVNGFLRLATAPERSADVSQELASAGVRISEIRSIQPSLEEVFLELTKEGENRI